MPGELKVSEFYDPKYVERFKEEPLLHHYVMFPAIIQILGDVKGKNILDVGCGAGALSCILADKGASVTGVDISEACINSCRKDFSHLKNLKLILSDGADMKEVESNNFDYVISNMVLINVQTKEQVQGIFNEAYRVLKPEGKLVFTDIHSIGLMTKETLIRTNTYPPDFSYFNTGAVFSSIFKMKDGSVFDVVNNHWTLEMYTDYLRNAKMYIDGIIEPQPVIEASKVPELREYKIPDYYIFTCKKRL